MSTNTLNPDAPPPGMAHLPTTQIPLHVKYGGAAIVPDAGNCLSAALILGCCPDNCTGKVTPHAATFTIEAAGMVIAALAYDARRLGAEAELARAIDASEQLLRGQRL